MNYIDKLIKDRVDSRSLPTECGCNSHSMYFFPYLTISHISNFFHWKLFKIMVILCFCSWAHITTTCWCRRFWHWMYMTCSQIKVPRNYYLAAGGTATICEIWCPSERTRKKSALLRQYGSNTMKTSVRVGGEWTEIIEANKSRRSLVGRAHT